MNINLIPILLPFFSALLILAVSEKTKYLKELLSIGVTLTALLASIITLGNSLGGDFAEIRLPWLYNLAQFSLKADMLSAFILASVSLFSLLIAIYSFSFENKGPSKWFYFNLLFTQALAAGAVMSDSLITMLFFWEGMLVFLYTFIALSKTDQASKNTALKAFMINAVTDICLMTGVIITGYLASTFNMSEIAENKLVLSGWATFGYVLLLIGAMAKAGAFPFHTWIPDAATDSSAAFMSYVPAAIDKLIGIYFLARASVYLYKLDGTMSMVVMSIGALTIIIAVMMAFVQQDYKRLLSYHAVSQTGYMILGIGTLHPIGIAGGLFHMLNNAVYKSCLFMTAGSVEKQAGTNSIDKLGGLFRNMPVTAVCFIIAAAAISGIAPLNGFFSKELVYKGALETGHVIFFLAAEIGSFLTLASFLKLGHSVFFGKRPQELAEIREAPVSMLLPTALLAGLCLAFGFGAFWPINVLIAPSLANLGMLPACELSGFHLDNLYWVSVIVILLAVANHILGVSLAGNKASKASDHIHHAPVLKPVYEMAEKRYFDLYHLVMNKVPAMAKTLFKVDRLMDKLTDDLPSASFNAVSKNLGEAHNGSYLLYMAVTFVGIVAYILFIGGMK